jgi:ankyrin repeat protein
MELIRFLIDHGANVHITDKKGNNVMHSAAKNDAVQVLYFFHDMEVDFNAKNKLGNTPLHTAVIYRNQISLKYLTSLGANLDIQNERGMTPLHIVVKSSQEFSKEAEPMLKRLLLKGARIDIKDNEGKTPLQLLVAMLESPNVDEAQKRTVLPKIRRMLVRRNCCQRYFCMDWTMEKPSKHKSLTYMYILLTFFSFFVH